MSRWGCCLFFLFRFVLLMSRALSGKARRTSRRLPPVASGEWRRCVSLARQKTQSLFADAAFLPQRRQWYRKEFPSLLSSAVGYLGGTKDNPSYQDVCTGSTGHAEVLQVEYDDKTKYEDLCRFFFRVHDPTTANRQGNDRGTQYRSAIFYHTPEQKEVAEKVLKEVEANPKAMKTYEGPKIVTEIAPASRFFKAEDYHQRYLDANPGGYCNHKVKW